MEDLCHQSTDRDVGTSTTLAVAWLWRGCGVAVALEWWKRDGNDEGEKSAIDPSIRDDDDVVVHTRIRFFPRAPAIHLVDPWTAPRNLHHSHELSSSVLHSLLRTTTDSEYFQMDRQEASQGSLPGSSTFETNSRRHSRFRFYRTGSNAYSSRSHFH